MPILAECAARLARLRLVLGLVLLLVLPAGLAAVEDDDLAEVFRRGDYAAVLAADWQALDTAARDWYLRALLRTGAYERVLELVPAAQPGAWRPRRIDALTALARLDEALVLTEDAEVLPLLDRRRTLLEALGRRREAQALVMQVIARFRQAARDPAADPAVVIAYARCLADRDPQTAFTLTTALGDRQPPVPDGRAEAGFICLERFQWSLAEEEFAAVLAADPRHPRALLGMALVSASWGQQAEAEARLDELLAVNPQHPAGLAARARLALLDGRDAVATAALDALLTQAPGNQQALALRAAAQDRVGAGAARDERLAAITAINPVPVEAWLTLAEVAHADGRLPAALHWSQQALAAVPGHWRAEFLAGLALLLQGRDAEAERRLLASFDANDFNIWAYNLLTILELERDPEVTASFTGKHFTLRCPRGPAELLWPLLQDWLDASIRRLAERFGVTAPTDEQRLRIVLCPDEEELAARTGHLPGFVGNARGFGGVVVARIPSLDDAAWPWYQAIEYGIAEAFAQRAGDWNLPPWLRRGLAWRALRPTAPADRLPLQAAVLDEALPYLGERVDAADEDTARRRGELLARYAHAFIDRHLTPEQVPALCAALAAGEALPVVWREAVGEPLEDSEAAFRSDLVEQARQAPVVVPLDAAQLAEHAKKPEALEPWSRLRLGVTWLDRGEYEAARELLEPLARHERLAAHAFGQLARLAWAAERDAEASTAMLVEALERDQEHFGSLLLGAQIAREQGEDAIARAFLDKLLAAHPRVVASGPQPRLLLADLERRQDRPEAAVELLRQQLELAPDDRGARLRLLRLQQDSGDLVALRPLAEAALKRWCFAEPALQAALRCYRDAGAAAAAATCETFLALLADQRAEEKRRRAEVGEGIQ